MALDLQQRTAQHGHRRHHPEAETENGCIALLFRPPKKGRITDGQQLRPDDNDDGSQNKTYENRKHTVLLVIWLKSLIILWQHDGQDRLPVVTGADMGDDIDGFFPSWGHQEVGLEGDPVGVDGLPGSEQGQNHQIMESAGDRLPLTLEPGRRFDIAVEQVIGDDGVELEADSLRGFGDVDQDAIGNRLLPGITINDVPAVILRHCQHHPAFGQATFSVSYESSQ